MKRIAKIAKMLVLTLMLSLALESVAPMFNDVVTAQAATKEGVKLNASKKTLTVGKTFQLKLTGTKTKPGWSSSNKKVATVSKNGKVTAKAEGTATITAKINSKKYTCKITVKAASNQLVTDAPFEAQEMQAGKYNIIIPKSWEVQDMSMGDYCIKIAYPKESLTSGSVKMVEVMAFPFDLGEFGDADYDEIINTPDMKEKLQEYIGKELASGQTIKDFTMETAKKGDKTYLVANYVAEDSSFGTIHMTMYFSFENNGLLAIAPVATDEDGLSSMQDIVDYMLKTLTYTK